MTLPITPGRGRSFLTLVTPFVADIYAKALQAELIVVLNTVGIKSESHGVSPSEQHKNYQRVLFQLGMGSARCEHDGTELYESFFHSEMSRIEELSLLQRSKRNIAWCSCGRVEIPVDAALKILADQRSRTLISGSSFAEATCAICHSSLVSGYENTSHLHLQKVAIEAEPSMYSREIETAVDRTVGRDIVVTRNHRGPCEKFDTDFRWYGYVGCFAEPGDDVVIVTSHTTFNQAVKVVLYCRIVYPDIKIRLFVHPLLRVIDRKVKLSTMNIQEFFSLMDPTQARMFLSIGMQWTASESFVGSEEIHLIKQTSQKIADYDSSWTGCVAGSFCNVFTRGSVSSLYKQIRQSRALSHQQAQLIHLIQPSR